MGIEMPTAQQEMVDRLRDALTLPFHEPDIAIMDDGVVVILFDRLRFEVSRSGFTEVKIDA